MNLRLRGKRALLTADDTGLGEAVAGVTPRGKSVQSSGRVLKPV